MASSIYLGPFTCLLIVDFISSSTHAHLSEVSRENHRYKTLSTLFIFIFFISQKCNNSPEGDTFTKSEFIIKYDN